MSKFNVGDYVKISKGSSLSNNYLKDRVYQVSEIDYNKIRVNLIVPAGSRNTNVAPWWNEVEFDYFPYVAPKPPRTFKVGDLVTWSTENYNYCTEDATIIFKVVDIGESTNGYVIHIDGFPDSFTSGTQSWVETKFDLYVEPRKFNVGDKVKFNTNSLNVYEIAENLPNGEVLISRVSPNKFKNGNQNWHEDSFKLYVEPEPELVEWHTLRIGTLVKINLQGPYNGKTGLVVYQRLICLGDPVHTWAPTMNKDEKMIGSFKVEVLPKDTEFTLKQV